MDILIKDYSQKIMRNEVVELIREIYPDWANANIQKLVYDENIELHVSTQVAICDKKIVGQANIFRLANDSSIANLCFHVHPDYRQLGLGTRLSTLAMDKAKKKGITVVVVQTESSNYAAINLIEKLGFMQPSLLFLHENATRLIYQRLEDGVCLYKEI